VSWFRERLHRDFETGLRIERTLYSGRSEFQDIAVFENPTFGRVLTLDGVVQTTERDEFYYHEMLVHPALAAHGQAREVLIVGGGDGGALEEVLKHPVARATVVELDPKVIEVSRRYLPRVGGAALDDPRTELVIADAAAWIAASERRFDVILVDSPDPIGPAAVLFGADFYGHCRRCLADDGFLVTQNGVPFLQADELTDGARLLRELFAHAGFYYAAVPSYTGGVMAFGWASAGRDLGALPVTAPRFATDYYSAAIHRAAFAAPAWVARALENRTC
jgi:spermidine synthase